MKYLPTKQYLWLIMLGIDHRRRFNPCQDINSCTTYHHYCNLNHYTYWYRYGTILTPATKFDQLYGV
jgi:hypothetical protein